MEKFRSPVFFCVFPLLHFAHEGSAIPNYISINQFILIVFFFFDLVFRSVRFSVAHRSVCFGRESNLMRPIRHISCAKRTDQNPFVYNFNCDNKPFPIHLIV